MAARSDRWRILYVVQVELTIVYVAYIEQYTHNSLRLKSEAGFVMQRGYTVTLDESCTTYRCSCFSFTAGDFMRPWTMIYGRRHVRRQDATNFTCGKAYVPSAKNCVSPSYCVKPNMLTFASISRVYSPDDMLGYPVTQRRVQPRQPTRQVQGCASSCCSPRMVCVEVESVD